METVFTYNLIRSEIDSRDMVSQLNFSVPCRKYISLILNHCKSNYDLHKPFRVLWIWLSASLKTINIKFFSTDLDPTFFPRTISEKAKVFLNSFKIDNVFES